VKGGEQAYVIFPLIDETEKKDLLAARREFDRLKKGCFASVRMGLVHGRVGAEEREGLMRAFRDREIRILVATSVVEVGVDNPNATVMVIENAERFGLSQLHQLRGRIGRGEKPSECFLFGEPKTVEGQKRLRIMTKTRDGFVIAEEDLRLRGPGEFLGTRQSGAPLFRTADLVRDQDVLFDAREAASHLLKTDPSLGAAEWAGLRGLLESIDVRF
jgi:ATP-dependent DNA helicase RecG